jgi:hypothetical protein
MELGKWVGKSFNTSEATIYNQVIAVPIWNVWAG